MPLAAIVLGMALAARASPAGADSPVVRSPVHQDVSPPLRSIPPAPRPSGPPREAPEPGRLPPRPAGNAPDAVTQTWNGPLAIPAPSPDFEGIGQGFSGPQGTFTVNYAPPDTDGDIGPNHYVQIVNVDFAVFNRSGTVLYGPVPTKTLWSGFGGGCQTNNDGDAVVKYDKRADRWIFSQFSVSTKPYLQCLAISQTGDPTGSYNRYSFSFSDFPDYPKLAVWPDAYYVTYNMFNGGSFVGGELCAYDRATMLTGGAATQQCFAADANMGGSLPSDVDGPTDPPAGAPNYVLAFGTNSLMIWEAHIDWGTPGSSSLTGPTTLSTAAFSPACGGGVCVPQPGTKTQLDSLADRLMFRLAYRNFGDHESLVVNHSVVPSGSGVGISGVRWYEVRSPGSSPTIFQQGTYAPADGASRWMGSIAMDGSGDVAMGYSVSSGTVFPSIRYTGRLVGDPLGTMPQGEASIRAGTGSQTTGPGGALHRWGDYSSIAVDPVDDCTFWYTNEYIASDGIFNWQTRIGSFQFPSCGSCPSRPTAVASGSNTICAGQSTPLSGSGGVSCSWSPSTGLSNASSCTPNASPASTTTYTLTVTDADGCTSTNAPTVTVTVNPKPNPVITPGGATTFCQGGSVQLDAGSGYSSYLWSPGGATTQKITVTASGSYTVTVTNGFGCSGTSSPVAVTVNPLPTAVASGSNTICAGQSTPLSGSGGVSCSWSPSTGLSNASSCTPSASPSSTTTYTLTVTDSHGCTSTNAPTATVTVNPKPSPTITPGGATTFCQGGSVQLDAGSGYASYLWSPGGATTQKITVTASGSYSVTVTNGFGCSGTSSSVSVTVNPLPTALASGSNTICAGDSTPLSGAGSGGTSPYTCSWSPSTGLSSASSCSPSASPSSTTTYTLTVTDAHGCSSTNAATATVTVTACTVSPKALAADASANGILSDGNGVFEPGEAVKVAPSWENLSGSPLTLTGGASSFTGSATATYAIPDASASYGNIPAGQTASCASGSANCYVLSVSTPASRPAHWDATFLETLSTGTTKTWTLHIGNSFSDVPKSDIFYRVVETVFHRGITGGCGDGTTFCPNDLTTRAQMATFITVAVAGGGANVPFEEPPGDGSIYNCTDSGGLSQFTDVPPSSTGFCRFINYLKFLKITSGCSNGTIFCPDDFVTRGQMAVFTAAGVEVTLGNTADPGGSVPRWKQSADLSREYNCTSSPQIDPDTGNTIPANTAPFLDVAASDAQGSICPFVGFLYVNKAVSGDGSGHYLPGSNIVRQETAAIMTGAFSLTLYGP